MTAATDLPRASVVVAARNAADTLPECIESLLGLDYPAELLELIVVDNRSSDGTAALVSGYGDRLLGLSETTLGAGAARNRGLSRASGEVVAFTDADCTVAPDWLRSLAPVALGPRVAVAGGRILARRPCSAIERFGEDIHDHARAMTQSTPYAISMNWATRRSLLQEVGGFDEALLRCQDVDLARRLVGQGYELVYVDEAVVYHRNESTLAGLLHEGFVHGRGGRILRELGAAKLPDQAARSHSLRRVVRDVSHLLRGPEQRRSFYRLLFDLGKVAGEVAGGRRQRLP